MSRNICKPHKELTDFSHINECTFKCLGVYVHLIYWPVTWVHLWIRSCECTFKCLGVYAHLIYWSVTWVHHWLRSCECTFKFLGVYAHLIKTRTTALKLSKRSRTVQSERETPCFCSAKCEYYLDTGVWHCVNSDPRKRCLHVCLHSLVLWEHSRAFKLCDAVPFIFFI